MDGIEVTKRILEGSLEEDQPSIIAMTADATELDRNECQDSRMECFMSKPMKINAVWVAL
jgi:CheY-like chemotaxis protein